ncbi:hypothetical protein F2P81_000580 [Scophthalmus maximus]|uniref:Uncharacterized protein n=1 Tax=Scophthalmus maximus TaxID=52904 RepID=A0A6A4TJG7_SCOMX|nr:hypothetical protein F2P81_000580 [Scophthalmus maximus]
MQITAQRRWIKILDQIPTGSEISVFGITADQLIDDQIIRLREPIAWWRQTDAKVSNSKSAKTVLIFPTMLVSYACYPDEDSYFDSGEAAVPPDPHIACSSEKTRC